MATMMTAKTSAIVAAMAMIWSALIALSVAHVTIEKSVYKDLVVEIKDNVPVAECATILNNLEASFTAASQFLFSALDGRAHFGNVIVLLPSEWKSDCLPHNRTVQTARGERSDFTLTRTHPLHRDAVWTQQATAGCGEPGIQMYGAYGALSRTTIGRELVREWAKYRYGVFDEVGYANDPIYPQCYRMEKGLPTGCSDAPIVSNGLCTATHQLLPRNATASADPTARTSIMFSTAASSDASPSARSNNNVVMFCDEGTHNRYAPTPHNHHCHRHSTLDVILRHADFAAVNLGPRPPSASIVDTRPQFHYKRRQLTRYVLIIDETRDTQLRESWSFLRMAIRKWLVYDLPANTEVGIILANDTASAKRFDLTALDAQRNRDYVASFVPFSPSETQRPACIACAVRDAVAMLEAREQTDGPAAAVVLIVAPGMDFGTDVRALGALARAARVKLATINYPGVVRRQPLDALAAQVRDHRVHTVYERKQNGEKSLLTTYFELSNVFSDVLVHFFEGNRLQLPIEIHRRELLDASDSDITGMANGNGGMGGGSAAAKRISRQITATFVLDEALGTPSSFHVYTHNAENPLIRSAKLTSPSGVQTSIRSDQRLPVKQLAISAVIGEMGTWTYTIDRYNGDPQPHYVQVMATARSTVGGGVVLARAWTRRPRVNVVALYVEVRKGELPVSAAAVEVLVTRPDVPCNATAAATAATSWGGCTERFRVLDTGSGDPDLQRGDGIYTRYFDIDELGARSGQAVKFEITVTDNGQQAYALADNFGSMLQHTDGAAAAMTATAAPCCGSFVPVPVKQPLTSFQRVLPAITLFVDEPVEQTSTIGAERNGGVQHEQGLGRIGDLRAELATDSAAATAATQPPQQQRVRLAWTAPDLGGRKVARYEVKYALQAADLIDDYETAAVRWEHEQPLAFAAGDETTLLMNVAAVEPQLLGRWLFVAVRAYSDLTMDARAGPVSNVASVFVPRPQAASTHRPAHSSADGFFAFGGGNGAEGADGADLGDSVDGDEFDDASRASLYDLNWELLIPIIAGIFLVAIVIIAFCYFCILRRQKKEAAVAAGAGDFPTKLMLPAVVVAPKKVENGGGSLVGSGGSPLHSIPHHMQTPEHHQHQSLQQQQHQQQQQQQHHLQYAAYQQQYHPVDLDVPDHHTVGLPIYSSEEEIHKKRYSIVTDAEHHLIQKMKHQQQQHLHQAVQRNAYRPPSAMGVSIISSNNNTLQTAQSAGRMFDTWTPSQLLVDHRSYDDLGIGQPQQQQSHAMQQQQPDQYSLLGGNMHAQQQQHHLQQQQQQQQQHMQQQQQQLIDHLSMSSGSNSGSSAPPVPPLPYGSESATYPAGNLYGTAPMPQMQQPLPQQQQQQHLLDQPPAYMTSMNQTAIAAPGGGSAGGGSQTGSNQFNTSLQGSMNSVHSGDKKKTRNVTMV